MLDSEVDKYRGEDGKVDKDVKDGFYRCLKIFKAKLADYESSAANQLIAYQQTMGKPQDEGDKRIGKFQSDCKQRLTSAALTLKQLLLARPRTTMLRPSKRISGSSRKTAARRDWWPVGSATTATWICRRGRSSLHYRSYGSLPGVERNSSEDQVQSGRQRHGQADQSVPGYA